MYILAYAFAGLLFAAAATILWIATGDRRFAWREKRRREKLIARALKGAER